MEELDWSAESQVDELLEVMERATARLDLPWKRAKMVEVGVVSMSVIFLAITP